MRQEKVRQMRQEKVRQDETGQDGTRKL